MSLFSEDVSAIFDDVLAEDAEHLAQDGSGAVIRVIPRMPDRVTEFNGGRFRSTTMVFLVPTTAAETIRSGDAILFGGETWIVNGQPLRDNRQLWWSVEVRRQ